MKQNKTPKKKKETPVPHKERLPEQFGKIIEFIDDSKKKEEAYEILSGISITQIESKSIIGPLPCSEEMKNYEKVQPGSADRIIGMAEKEQIHRHVMDKSEQPVRHRQLKRGQWFSLAVGVGGLGVATLLALTGHDWVAALIATITIGTILTAFIYTW